MCFVHADIVEPCGHSMLLVLPFRRALADLAGGATS